MVGQRWKIGGNFQRPLFAALILAKEIKNKLRTKPGLLSHRTKNKKVFRLAILKIIRTKHQNRAWLPLTLYHCTACKLVLLSHFNIAKLFNDHILFKEYTSFKFVFLLYIRQSSFTILPHVSSKIPFSFEKIRTN